VLAFRNLYPGLDPYACQAAFDAWQAGLEPERRAKRYNAAFLGFAKSKQPPSTGPSVVKYPY
jgi:hypothetical protein